MENERLLMCLCLPVRVKRNGAGGGGSGGGGEGWEVLVASSKCVYFCAHALY